MTAFCAQNKAISENSDVYIGFVGWGAGSFDTSYILTLTPLGKPGNYTDNKLMNECILDQFTLDEKYRPTPTSISTAAEETATATATSDGDAPSTTKPIFREETASPTPNAVTKPSPDTSDSSDDDKDSAASMSAQGLTGTVLFTVAALGYMLVAF
jgi:endoglucanase